MSLTKNVIRPLAAVAIAVLLAGCAGQAPQEAQTPAPKPSSQPTPAEPLPEASSETPQAPQGPETHRLAVVDLLTAGVLDMNLVESVMPDGSTVTPDQARFHRVHVAGITAPEPGGCGAAVSMSGARSLINSLFDQDPDLAWTDQRREEVLPTYLFEAPAADIDEVDTRWEVPTVNLSVDGVLLAQELVSAGLALDSDGRWAQEQASAQADDLGIWAECPAP